MNFLFFADFRKKHLFIGRFLALFLIEAMKQALMELDKYEKQYPLSKAPLQELYVSMKSMQDYDVNEFLRNTDITMLTMYREVLVHLC